MVDARTCYIPRWMSSLQAGKVTTDCENGDLLFFLLFCCRSMNKAALVYDLIQYPTLGNINVTVSYELAVLMLLKWMASQKLIHSEQIFRNSFANTDIVAAGQQFNCRMTLGAQQP